jgi:hypothetical protein
MGFVHDLQMTALVQLGKIVHPVSQQSERNLPAAKGVIDLLGMLEMKTRGNLSSEENRFLQQVLTTLRLNYVDEASRPEAAAEAPAAESERRQDDGAEGPPSGPGDSAETTAGKDEHGAS